MSALVCAMSGLVPSEPVVSVKSGLLFEKKLIMKYVQVSCYRQTMSVIATSVQCPYQRARYLTLKILEIPCARSAPRLALHIL